MKLWLCSVAWTGCCSWEHPAREEPAHPAWMWIQGIPRLPSLSHSWKHIPFEREFHLQVSRFWIILPNPLQYYEWFLNLTRVFLWTLPVNSAVICIVMGRAARHGKNLPRKKCCVLGEHLQQEWKIRGDGAISASSNSNQLPFQQRKTPFQYLPCGVHLHWRRISVCIRFSRFW